MIEVEYRDCIMRSLGREERRQTTLEIACHRIHKLNDLSSAHMQLFNFC